jgi:uncharacterized cupredoxin-like copper-binding protein
MQTFRSAFLSICLLGLISPSASSSAALPPPHIAIRERAFIPEVLSLKIDELVTLTIKNEDGELHAFVPLLLFQGLNVMVTGNGAPEFNDTGFARVLIPPHGQAGIRFQPRTAGRFHYICDLPGHQMRGEIIVTGDSR